MRNTYNRSKVIEDKLKRDEARTNYKNICKVKFHTYQDQQTTALYREKYNDPKSYWKKIKPRNQKVKTEVSLQSFKEHFKSLYTLQSYISSIGMSTYNMYVDELDTPITMSEAETDIHHLKPDKAAGDDNIRCEFILYGSESLKSSILVIFNKLYDTSFYPEIWSTRVIVPIYKKGDPKEPANYRCITLTSTMSKLFTYILNQRLSSWFEQSGAASQAQFAYKKKNSTADAVFVLSSLISHSLKKSNVFCAFIDFTKAFDSIDRNLFYAKLMGYKISDKMLKMIVNIYSKVKSKVKTEGVSTGTYNLWMGLMQGE